MATACQSPIPNQAMGGFHATRRPYGPPPPHPVGPPLQVNTRAAVNDGQPAAGTNIVSPPFEEERPALVQVSRESKNRTPLPSAPHSANSVRMDEGAGPQSRSSSRTVSAGSSVTAMEDSRTRSAAPLPPAAAAVAKLAAYGLQPLVFNPVAAGPGQQPPPLFRASRPSWMWIMYALLRRSPSGLLTMRELFELGLAWFPGLDNSMKQDPSASCRSILSREDIFVSVVPAGARKAAGQWRIARIGGNPPPL